MQGKVAYTVGGFNFTPPSELMLSTLNPKLTGPTVALHPLGGRLISSENWHIN